MIDALERLLDLWAPVEAVIKRRVAKQQEGTQKEDSAGDLGRHALGQHNQDDSAGNHKRQNTSVNPTAPSWLYFWFSKTL